MDRTVEFNSMARVTTDFAAFTVILALLTWNPTAGVTAAVVWLLAKFAITAYRHDTPEETDTDTPETDMRALPPAPSEETEDNH